MSSLHWSRYTVWDRALDAIARESRHIRRHRLGAWRPGRCDPRPPPRRILPWFRYLDRLRGLSICGTFYPLDGPGPPADVKTTLCPGCGTPIQLWADENPRSAARDSDPESVLIPNRD